MIQNRVLVLAVVLASSASVLAVACGEDTERTIAIPSGTDASASGKDGSSSGSSGGEEDSGGPGKTDAGTDAGDLCVGQYEAPVISGAGPCGTSDFGEPASTFVGVDPDGGVDYVGTSLPSGIYDAVKAERLSANGGSWRETFVVKGDRFTRIRQIDTGIGGGPGPISYRSGTFTYVGQAIKLTYDCAQTGDAGVDAGTDELPSDAVTTDCKARYRYGASGIRVTMRRR